MSLSRQSRAYLTIGIVQWVVDWAVVVALSHAGMGIEPANVLGRIAGAMLGFRMNGRFTFRDAEAALGGTQFTRYVVMWVATTIVSTWSLGMIDHVVGLHWAWLAKPAVEGVLGVVGFLLSRHWVYRR
ncbi:GtrA family protein [Cognatilysobacter lacus]|uniref:GtrA family protein n=1 Tax=Cognatilysobacter lacus TaxID=1643323 RepID=A0A5D8YY06_9GAMM|nr:GtrA family protein [Lysobacter lacus]TZF86702.1 GtrA family protein [Lysobacter lacus]